MLKTFSISACFIALCSPITVHAAKPIVLKHGLPTDIWLTWPDGDGLKDQRLIEVFPEFRQQFKGNEFLLAKKAGFDFIRLTIDPAIFLANPAQASTEKLLAGMMIAVSDIRGAGLKVLVDMHSIPRDGGGMGTEQILDTEKSFDRYLEVVGKVGRSISNLPPDQVAFELLNEPT
jgi:endoglucanase